MKDAAFIKIIRHVCGFGGEIPFISEFALVSRWTKVRSPGRDMRVLFFNLFRRLNMLFERLNILFAQLIILFEQHK